MSLFGEGEERCLETPGDSFPHNYISNYNGACDVTAKLKPLGFRTRFPQPPERMATPCLTAPRWVCSSCLTFAQAPSFEGMQVGSYLRWWDGPRLPAGAPSALRGSPAALPERTAQLCRIGALPAPDGIHSPGGPRPGARGSSPAAQSAGNDPSSSRGIPEDRRCLRTKKVSQPQTWRGRGPQLLREKIGEGFSEEVILKKRHRKASRTNS